MKFIVGIIIGALAGVFVGIGIAKVRASQRRMSYGSVAGETLTQLSRALELEKEHSGAYPESIRSLPRFGVGEFSGDLLTRVVYRRTMDGYVAFVGHPNVVFVEPGASAQLR